jgi:hypothetical protein
MILFVKFVSEFHPHHKPFMKKKSASQSAFFNPRILIGLCVILAGACLALFAANPFGCGTTAPAAGKTKAKPACHQLRQLAQPGLAASWV